MNPNRLFKSQASKKIQLKMAMLERAINGKMQLTNFESTAAAVIWMPEVYIWAGVKSEAM